MAERQHENFVTEARTVAATIKQAYYDLREIRDQWDKNGLSALAGNPPTFEGANDDISYAEILALMVTADEMRNWWDAGNGQNITGVLP